MKVTETANSYIIELEKRKELVLSGNGQSFTLATTGSPQASALIAKDNHGANQSVKVVATVFIPNPDAPKKVKK